MRIGDVGNQHIRRRDHMVRNIGVQVQGRDDRNVGADDIAHHLEQVAVRVRRYRRRHTAVGAEIDAV